MTSLKESTSKFEELKVRLISDTDDLETRLKNCELDANSGEDLLIQLSQLKEVESRAQELSKKLELLKSLGENLLETLDALDCRDTPKGKEIQKTMEDIPTRLHTLQEAAATKLRNQDDVSFAAFLKWAKAKQECLDHCEPVSLNRDILNQQIHSHHALALEIDQYHHQVLDMISHHENDPLYSEISTDIQEQFKILIEKVKQREATLENVVKKLEAFHLAIYQLESWFAYASHSVKQESVDLEFLFGKVQNLYSQKLEKEEHRQSLKSIASELLSDQNCGDKNRLEDLLKDIDEKWLDVQNELVHLTVSVAQRQMECYSKHLEKVAKEYGESDMINADPEKVTKQYADEQETHTRIKKRHNEESELIEKYKTIYRGLTNQEPTDIQSSWISVQKEYTAIIKHSESHMAELQEALPAQLSADIEVDEILQEWIEVDTINGKKEKPKPNNAKDGSTPVSGDKHEQSGTMSPGVRAQSKSSPAAAKSKEKELTDEKKTGLKQSSKTSEKKAAAKQQDENCLSSIFDSESSDPKKDKATEGKKHSSAERQGSKTEKEKSTSKKSSSSSKKVENKSAVFTYVGIANFTFTEKWGPADIDLRRDTKGSRYKFFDYGIVILNCKDSVRMTEIRKFVNRVTKAGFIKFYRENQKVIKIAVFLNHEKDVNKCVLHLNNKILGGRKVTVLKAKLHREGLESLRHHSRSSKSNDNVISHKRPSVKKVIPFEEIKRSKAADFAGKMNDRVRPYFKTNQGKKIISLNELRATKPLARTIHERQRFHIMDLKQRRPFISPRPLLRTKQLSPDIDLEVERRKLMIERQALERERLQAERERIALERERQRRQMEEMCSPGQHRRGHKREFEAHRDDGSYWSEPKRPMYERFRDGNKFPVDNSAHPNRLGSMTRLPERHSAERRHSFEDIHHGERNTFRPIMQGGPPGSVYSKPDFLPKGEMLPRSDMKVAYKGEPKTWAPVMRDDMRKIGERRAPPRYEGRQYKEIRHDRPIGRLMIDRHHGEPVNKPGNIRMLSPRAHMSSYGNPVRKSNMNNPWK